MSKSAQARRQPSSSEAPADIQVSRERRGYSRQDLAKLIGLASGTLKNIEKRKTKPGADALNRIASALGLEFDKLHAAYRPGEPVPSPTEIRPRRGAGGRRGKRKSSVTESANALTAKKETTQRRSPRIAAVPSDRTVSSSRTIEFSHEMREMVDAMTVVTSSLLPNLYFEAGVLGSSKSQTIAADIDEKIAAANRAWSEIKAKARLVGEGAVSSSSHLAK